MTTIGMTLRPRRKRTRSDCVERNGNVAEQHEQDADRTGNDVVMDDDDAAAGLVALRGEPEEEDEREAAHGLVALRKRVNIVFEKVEDDDVVNAVFDGYVDKTQGKVIVVAEEKKRLAFFTKKPEIGASGTLKKQLPSREEQYNAYRKGKEKFIAESFEFDQLEDAKAFVRDPQAALDARKRKAERTKAQRQPKAQPPRKKKKVLEFRNPTWKESFYRKKYEGTIYKHFPKPGKEPTDEMRKKQSELFENAQCDARKEVPKKDMYGKEKKNVDYLTFSFRISGQNLSKRKKAALQSARHVCRQIYNAAIFLIKGRDAERIQAYKENKDEPQWHTEKELRNEVYGYKDEETITPGMKNCAEQIVSQDPPRETEKLVRKSWNQIPYKMKEDAVQQATSALKTNLSKAKKRKERNPDGKIKPFSLGFRKYSQPSVINLPFGNVITNFVKAEKKVKEKKDEGERSLTESQKKRQERKKNREKEKKPKGKKKEKTLTTSERTQPSPRSEDSPNKKVHFFAKFSRTGWCRDMEVLDEKESLPDGLKSGIRLCGSKKVVDQILENECKNVVQTKLRYNPKTKQHFIDVVIEVPKTSEKKEGIAVIGGTDMGNTPFCTFLSGSTGKYFNEDILEQNERETEKEKKNGGRELLFRKAEEILELDAAFEKKSWEKYKEVRESANLPVTRTRKQFLRSKKKLKQRYYKALVSFRNYRKKFHYMLANEIIKKCDVLVHNKLNSKRIYEESKKTYIGPGTKARSNAANLAQGYFAETLKQVIRRTPGKKYITGGGERGTSKTCLYCAKWKPKLEVSDKEFVCKNPKCKEEYPRDAGSCTSNMNEAAQIQHEREKAQERAERAEQQEQEQAQQDEQDEQEQAETEGRRRSQRPRVQRNQSDQHPI